MGTPDRRAIESLIRQLQMAPWKFDFFQAARLLKSALGLEPGAWSDDQHTIEFFQEASLGFDAAPVAGVRKAERKFILNIRGFGLFGGNGPLPLWLTDFAMRQRFAWLNNRPTIIPERLKPGQERDPLWTESSFVAFCHLFQNRMIRMLYQAWETHHKAPSLEGCGGQYSERPFSRSFFCFTGLLPHLVVDAEKERQGATTFSPYGHLAEMVAFFSGRLCGIIRNPEGLAAILTHELKVDAEIREFHGSWINVPIADRWQLNGSLMNDRSQHGFFGIVGERTFDYQMKFLIRLGPLSLAQYLNFFLPSPERQRLLDIVSIYAGSEFGWETQLILDRSEVPPFCLPLDALADAPLRLGQTTWLYPVEEDENNEPRMCRPERHPADVILEPELEWN